MVDIKKLDKRLHIKKNIDGTILVQSHSKFNRSMKYDILEIRNQYIKSNLPIYTKLQSMDSQRFDIIKDVMNKNLALYKKREDDRMHRELASFVQEGEKIII